METHKVTLEEYDQSLRSAVNAYYEHAMQDPNMSHEEAIANTAKMSEEYLNAVDEFKAAMEEETNNAALSEETVTENNGVADDVLDSSIEDGTGVDNDGGIDDDGGIDNDGGIE